jgi:hypothetical protein
MVKMMRAEQRSLWGSAVLRPGEPSDAYRRYAGSNEMRIKLREMLGGLALRESVPDKSQAAARGKPKLAEPK